jgi:hypothetical protein
MSDTVEIPISALDDDANYRAAVTDLLGLLAYGELMAFERLAADSALAPTIEDTGALASHAAAEQRHYELLRARLIELGADPSAAMAPFVAPINEFHERTMPSDWLEGLVKAVVGDGIGADFYREISVYVDAQTREIINQVMSETGNSDYAVAKVRAAIKADPTVAGRLALWARRLLGEAVTQAQHVIAERETLDALFVAPVAGATADLAEVGRVIERLTDKHYQRMVALGLTESSERA